MPFRRHLSDAEIEAIYDAAIDLGLADSRDTLFAGLSRAFSAGLSKKASNPAEQLQSDLQAMNTIEALEDDESTVPLRRWLSTAYQLNKIRREAKVFKIALDKLAASAAAAPPIGVAAPPPHPLRWGQKLTGAEHGELCDALRSALPTRDALARMLRTRLDKKLDEIAGGGNLTTTVFEVVNAAEAEGWVPRLFDAALAEVPGNANLRAIADKRRA
jgi:hypothetical protein